MMSLLIALYYYIIEIYTGYVLAVPRVHCALLTVHFIIQW